MVQHKPGCTANVSCMVIHLDGVCPGPYGKCDCGVDATVSMNTQPCCSSCQIEDWENTVALRQYKCGNPSCQCHLGQDWKNALPMVGDEFCQGHLNDLEKAINSLLAEQKKAATIGEITATNREWFEKGRKAAYELGVEHGENNIKFDKAVEVNKGIEAGRKETISRILSQWPKDKTIYRHNPIETARDVGYNEGLAAGKAVVEELKKLSN